VSAAFRVHRNAAVRPPRRPRPEPPTVTTVPAIGLREALRLAGGDASRLRVRSADTILVVNQGRTIR